MYAVISSVGSIINNTPVIIGKLYKTCIFYALTFKIRNRKNNPVTNIRILRKSNTPVTVTQGQYHFVLRYILRIGRFIPGFIHQFF